MKKNAEFRIQNQDALYETLYAPGLALSGAIRFFGQNTFPVF
ncbi:hypothetical protein [Nostoc sp.]